jgi:hypothetical protein
MLVSTALPCGRGSGDHWNGTDTGDAEGAGLSGWIRAAHSARRQDAVEPDALIESWANGLPADSLLAVLTEHGVPASSIYSAADMISDPHYLAREMVLRPVGGDVGPMPGIVPKFSRTPGRVARVGPSLGADTEQVPADLLGLGDEVGTTTRTWDLIVDSRSPKQRSNIMILVTSKITCVAGQEDTRSSRPLRSSRGRVWPRRRVASRTNCIRDISDPSRFVFVDESQDGAAIREYVATSHFAEFNKIAQSTIASQVTRLHTVEKTRTL